MVVPDDGFATEFVSTAKVSDGKQTAGVRWLSICAVVATFVILLPVAMSPFDAAAPRNLKLSSVRLFASQHGWLGIAVPCHSGCRSRHVALLGVQIAAVSTFS